jgi:pectate lyase
VLAGASNGRAGANAAGGAGALGVGGAFGAAGTAATSAGGTPSASGGARTTASGGASGRDAVSGGAGKAGAAGKSARESGGASGSGGMADAGGHGGAMAGRSATTGGAGATGSAGANNDCMTPPPASPLVGWASESGMGVSTTTGGGDATPVFVTTLAELNSAVGGSKAAVVYVTGTLAAGSVKIGSNKTIVGLCGAEIHGHVDMNGSVNVVFRNLKVVGYDCSDSPSECKSGADAITVVNSAHHLWFDHADISDGSDGNLDITNGSDFVTVSWTKFWYSTKRTDPVTGDTGHRFSNLIGAADGLAGDAGHLNVTWTHDWWADNVAERMPRSRDGNIHVVNNLFTAAGNDYCTNSGNLSHLLVENNVYVGVNNPLEEDADGNMLSRGNVFNNTSGSKTASGMGFTPPYELTPDATDGLEATLRAQVGPH